MGKEYKNNGNGGPNEEGMKMHRRYLLRNDSLNDLERMASQNPNDIHLREIVKESYLRIKELIP